MQRVSLSDETVDIDLHWEPTVVRTTCFIRRVDQMLNAKLVCRIGDRNAW